MKIRKYGNSLPVAVSLTGRCRKHFRVFLFLYFLFVPIIAARGLEPAQTPQADPSLTERCLTEGKKDCATPALPPLRQVLAYSEQARLRDSAYYHYTRYETMSLALNDVNPLDTAGSYVSRHAKLKNFIERVGMTDKFVLPLFKEESVTDVLHRRTPERDVELLRGVNRDGINELYDADDITDLLLGYHLQDVQVGYVSVIIDGVPLPSPVGIGAERNYRYDVLYATDSLYHATFAPRDSIEGFTGDMHLTRQPDGTLRLKQVRMTLTGAPQRFQRVKNAYILQEFAALPNGVWVQTQNDIMLELHRRSTWGALCIVKSQRFSDFSFAPLPDRLFRGRRTVHTMPTATTRDSTFWARYRQQGEGVRHTETVNAYGRSDNFAKSRSRIVLGYASDIHALRVPAVVALALLDDYIELGTPARFAIMPVKSLVTFNELDGLRLRLGGTTTAALHPRLFLEGYYAYGFRFRQSYYRARLTYSFNRKPWLPQDFPRRYVYAESQRDLCYSFDRNNYVDRGNIFSSFRWGVDDMMMIYNRQAVGFEREERNHWRLRAALRTERDIATGSMLFVPLALAQGYQPHTDHGTRVSTYKKIDRESLYNGDMRTTELHFEAEYDNGSENSDYESQQMPRNAAPPKLNITHTIGLRGFLGGQYRYNASEIRAAKRWYLPRLGFVTIQAKAAIMWSQVPFPLLLAPTTNQSYFVREQGFYLLNTSEFLNDHYLQLMTSWNGGGRFLARTAIGRKTRAQEFLALRILWGGLSDKNNTALPQNADSHTLMVMPDNFHPMNTRRPYTEAVIGVHNIFRFLAIDYVHRVTYRRYPGGRSNGLRFTTRFNF